VEFKHGERSVWCPWSLSDVDGRGFASTYGQSVDLHLYVPLAREAIPYVEYRVDDACLASGLQVNTPQFAFRSDELARLWRYYEVYGQQIVDLLVHLGQQIGNAAALPPVLRQSLARMDRKGWITVPISHLDLPTRCCNCGGVFDEYVGFLCRTRMPFFVQQLQLAIPLCDPCQAKLKRRKWIWTMAGTVTGSIVSVLCCLLSKRMDDVGMLILAALSAWGGGLLGWALFHRFGLPVRADFIGFLEQTHVKLRFRLPSIAKEFMEERNAGAESD
jgi:hypothetical protein